MIVMYLITQEDTAATLVGSILGVAGVTLGLGAALLAWMVVLDIAWLRIACFVAFVFVGLFLKRVLTHRRPRVRDRPARGARDDPAGRGAAARPSNSSSSCSGSGCA